MGRFDQAKAAKAKCEIMPRNGELAEPDAERRFLACAMLDSSQIKLSKLTFDDFFEPRHGIIFDAIKAVHDETGSADEIIVAEHLKAHNLFAEIGGAREFDEIARSAEVSAYAPKYAAIIRDRSNRRRIIARASEEMRAARDLSTDQAHSPKASIGRPLPRATTADAIEHADVTERPELIQGWLRCGEFAMIAADAKMGKTWLGIELAHAVCTGGEWLGHRVEQRTGVAYLNFELQEATFLRRLKTVCHQRGSYPRGLNMYHLRGYETTVPELAHHIANELGGVGLIIIDSFYNTFGDRSENDNSEMGMLMREIQDMGIKVGASIVALHHYSKSSHMAATDSARASGASTIYRAVDNLTTLTRLTDEEIEKMNLPGQHLHARFASSLRSFRDTPPCLISKRFGDVKFHRDDRPLPDIMREAKSVNASVKAHENLAKARAAKALTNQR